MNNAKTQEYRIGPGASSLLMIFVALCLTTVAILALVSAMADTNMTNRSEQTIEAYYAAAARVQRELANVDGKLEALRKQSADPQAYIEGVFALADALDPSLKPSVQPVADSEDAEISFSAPMYGGHEIFVKLRIPAELQGRRYLLIAHMVQNTEVWVPDDSMNLLMPENGASFEEDAEAAN